MNADGSHQHRLTHNTASDTYGPDFSPNGKRVAFSSDRDGNYEIYVMNADGSHQRRLTNNSALDLSPAFSPNGKKIAFESDSVRAPATGNVRDARRRLSRAQPDQALGQRQRARLGRAALIRGARRTPTISISASIARSKSD